MKSKWILQANIYNQTLQKYEWVAVQKKYSFVYMLFHFCLESFNAIEFNSKYYQMISIWDLDILVHTESTK